ncbi:GlxA family transcriptional regulator [Actinoalloteichus hymeniacidonis]|uniref:AraC family transcription regulator n=1 Tax=Actinoalloteichus hymeniacidonis TaxID=340345 RepID=A0AAC9HPH8_9PSEU|nr:DJ-1/PfpI family protein [Actinoalloteichus hymeniacidonis]AOS63055.1 AraC family transcription regulator [Actinoalloteichus hymeniacidonis]MBB5908910.1 transcriptional regulator GlxA family with amidase domain [Actinoalloteichus hymeniacidonis]
MTRVLFLLAPGVHLLDFAGPAQVFSTAADLGLPYTQHHLGETTDIPTAQGIVLTAATDWPRSSPDDLIIVPGWRAPTLRGTGTFGAAALERLTAHHAAGGTVASVCAGADALGRAGLLDGRRCTTHHDVQDELAARHPRAIVVRDVLYVVDDRVVTSAGIASGIDLALHLVASAHGPAQAARVARAMVVYARRNGSDPQASVMLRHRDHLDDVVHRTQDALDARFSESLRLPELAAIAGTAERTLTRHFRRATGMTPLRYQQLLRVERAEHLIEQGSTHEAAARVVGFEDARMLRRLRARA